MVLYELWNAEVASETPLLSSSINHSLRAFGHHDHLKPIQSEAVQALHQGQDIFVNVNSCRLWKVADLPGATCACSTHLEEAEAQESCCVSSGNPNNRQLLSKQAHVRRTMYHQFIIATYSTRTASSNV